jgi:hypothetical protein
LHLLSILQRGAPANHDYIAIAQSGPHFHAPIVFQTQRHRHYADRARMA